MLYAFTDESYSSKFYFQGALIVNENELIALENLAKRILLFATKFGVHPDSEIHGHSIMNSVHGWESLDRENKSRNDELIDLWALVLRLIHVDFEPKIISLESTEGSQ